MIPLMNSRVARVQRKKPFYMEKCSHDEERAQRMRRFTKAT
jgi:hypothetical protein